MDPFRWNCRDILLILLALLLANSPIVCAQNAPNAAELTNSQKREVVQAAWQEVNDVFYDANYHGVNWVAVRDKYLRLADQAQNDSELEALLRQMLGELHNSHIGVMTHEEIAQTHSVLPFFFDRVDSRVFVSFVFALRSPSPQPQLRFGDEILRVDSQPASKLQMPSVTWLTPILQNPYFGPPNSIATVKIRRGHAIQSLRIPRVQAFSDVFSLVTRTFGPIGYIRMLKMDDATVPQEMLRPALAKLAATHALILDLRHCVGGDAPVSSAIGGMLLGPDIKLATEMPRNPHDAENIVVERTAIFAPVYTGKLIVLVDRDTQSEPEMLTAALKEYGRGTIIGETTRGAFNGFTQAIPLPYHSGILAVPVTKSVSPQGREYEGIGVTPNIIVRNAVSDFASSRDAVLDRAIQLAGR